MEGMHEDTALVGRADVAEGYGLIKKELARYPRQYHDELEQAGVVALVKAADAYDAQKGASYITYAWYKVHYGMLTCYQELTKGGKLITVPFTDIEAAIGRRHGDDDMSFEESISDGQRIEDLVDGLADSSVILGEVDRLGNRLQRVTMRYLSGLRGHAKIKNGELARMLGISPIRINKTYYEARRQLRSNRTIVELAKEKGVLRRDD